jgi:hypothetical protein
MSGRARWTHTATLVRSYPIGAEQFGHWADAGSTVELWQDPADQEGELITIRRGHDTGAARLVDLVDVERKGTAP